MRMKGFSLNDLVQLLHKYNWIRLRQKGSHITFQNIHTKKSITLTDHGKSKEICRPLVKRILKETGLLEIAYGCEC